VSLRRSLSHLTAFSLESSSSLLSPLPAHSRAGLLIWVGLMSHKSKLGMVFKVDQESENFLGGAFSQSR